jgi:hypothetical protein
MEEESATKYIKLTCETSGPGFKNEVHIDVTKASEITVLFGFLTIDINALKPM